MIKRTLVIARLVNEADCRSADDAYLVKMDKKWKETTAWFPLQWQAMQS